MNKTVIYVALGLILLVGGYMYWKNSSNPTGGGTQQLDSAVQQDLAYYQAWNQAQAQNNNTNSPTTGTIKYNGPVATQSTNSASYSLPVGV